MPQTESQPGASGETPEERGAACRKVFAPPPHADPAAPEARLERRVSEIIETFLRSARAHTEMDGEELARAFTHSAIPDDSPGAQAYLDFLNEHVLAHSTHTASPRYLGHMTSALPYFVRPLGKLLCALNQNLIKVETSKAFTPLERQTLAMVHRLVYRREETFYGAHIQDPERTLGVVCSGGTVANITALWCARNAALGPREGFAGVEREGLAPALAHYGYRGAAVVGSALMHYSFDKAVGLLGLGREGLLRVSVDERQRVEPAALREALKTCRAKRLCVLALVGVAGTTDAGSLDPLEELAELASEFGVHFHVDAAWGGPLLFSGRHRRKLAGIERADSVTIDGHKQLYCPLGIGLLLLRDPALAKAIETHAPYIIRKGSADLGRRALEGSRPGTALFLHAALHLLGQKNYAFLLGEGLRKARYLAQAAAARPEFERPFEPETNIVLYRYLPKAFWEKAARGTLDAREQRTLNRFNERLQEAQWRAGRSFISRTTLSLARGPRTVPSAPTVFLRAVLANPLTTEADMDAVLDEQVRLAAGLKV